MEERHGGNDRYDSNEQNIYIQMICPFLAPKAQHRTDNRDFDRLWFVDPDRVIGFWVRTQRSVKDLQDMKGLFMQRIKDVQKRKKKQSKKREIIQDKNTSGQHPGYIQSNLWKVLEDPESSSEQARTR